MALVPLLAAAGCTEGMPEDEQFDEEEVRELVEDVSGDGKVKGSCAILEQGTCFDYIGSIWTEQQMELNCKDAGIFSLNACPYSEVGGCQTSGGSVADTIIWSYLSTEEAGYQAKSCNALPGAKWVIPEDLLNR